MKIYLQICEILINKLNEISLSRFYDFLGAKGFDETETSGAAFYVSFVFLRCLVSFFSS